MKSFIMLKTTQSPQSEQSRVRVISRARMRCEWQSWTLVRASQPLFERNSRTPKMPVKPCGASSKEDIQPSPEDTILDEESTICGLASRVTVGICLLFLRKRRLACAASAPRRCTPLDIDFPGLESSSHYPRRRD